MCIVRKGQRRIASPQQQTGDMTMTKVLLIIQLLNGHGFAVPMTDMNACLAAEKALDTTQVEWSACDFDES